MLKPLAVESGENALTPWYVIPRRGLQRIYGQWGSIVPAPRTPLGATLLVPRRPRDRMGLCGPARKHARYQRQRHVHRIARYIVGWGGFYRAPESRSSYEIGLFGEAHRAWSGHGRERGSFRTRNTATIPAACLFSFHGRLLNPQYSSDHGTAVALKSFRFTVGRNEE